MPARWYGYCSRRTRYTGAQDILRPFADSGRWEAVESLASTLDAQDRTDEAITLVRRHAAAGGRSAGTLLAELLARQGRTDEVLTMLRPHVADHAYAAALVALTADADLDDEVAALLQAQISAKQHHVDPWQREPWNAELLLATVLERQGRVDDAVALLQAHLYRGRSLLTNHLEHLADLLARHGREEALRDLAVDTRHERAALRLATWWEEQARPEEAAEALRPFATRGSPNAAAALADLLTRHGRIDEAIELLRPIPKALQDPECIINQLCSLLTSQDRADEALAAIDDLAAHHGGMWTELHLQRSTVLARCGRIEQAITELRTGPDSGAWYITGPLADLLMDAGRPQEAIAVLRAAGPGSTAHLATLLIRQGRVREAVALFHDKAATKHAAKLEQDAAFWRWFRADDQPRFPAS